MQEDISNRTERGGKLSFSLASEQDVERIIELNSQFHLELPDFKWDTRDWIYQEIKKGNYYLAREDNAVLGAICLQSSKNELFIETIAIDKDYHGRGLGKELIRFAREVASQRKLHKVTVESFARYGLESFYLKSGFSKDNPYVDYLNGEPYYRFVLKTPFKRNPEK